MRYAEVERGKTHTRQERVEGVPTLCDNTIRFPSDYDEVISATNGEPCVVQEEVLDSGRRPFGG